MNKFKSPQSQLETDKVKMLRKKPRPFIGYALGFLIVYIASTIAIDLIAGIVGMIYVYFYSGTNTELEASTNTVINFLDTNDLLISLVADIIVIISSVLGGYVCSFYAKNRAYLLSVLIWLPLLPMGLFAYDEAWEKYLIILGPLIAILIGTYMQQRKTYST